MADFGFDKTIGNWKQTLYLMIPCHIGLDRKTVDIFHLIIPYWRSYRRLSS